MALIGKDIAPPDLIAKITGRAKYAEDFRPEGMVFMKLLLSPMPHARVKSIDASKARQLPGFLGILTADELPGEVTPPNERPLTMEPLYVGEPILAVAAVDETTAADAVELIDVDLEPLPFVLDPLESLKPDGPNARLEGNVRRRRDGENRLETMKWTQADFDAAGTDGLPMGEPIDEWTVGDLDAGFAEADLVTEEVVMAQSMTHHPLETRTTAAYWDNGKCYVYGSTQSHIRTKVNLARQLGLEPDELVFIGEYCGGGFGSKIAGSPSMQIPAVFSKKIGRPVMMRITRYEENFIGRGRPAFQAWVKIGYRNDGKVTAIDLYIVQDHGPYGSAGDHRAAADMASLAYTPTAMRFRGVSAYTNTPPRAAQRAPGGAQIVTMLEPMMDKAARELGIDRLEMRRINAPDGNTTFGRRESGLTSAFVREAIDAGKREFDWDAKIQLSGQRNGTKVTGVGVGLSPYTAGSIGFDGLMVIRPDGKLYVHQGIGNLGTHSIADTARAAADVLGLSWDQVSVVWGDSSKNLPWSSVQAGSQTTYAHTRANHAGAMDAKRKLQEIAAREFGGAPSGYETDGGRVFRKSDPSQSMTFARAARQAIALGGKYSGESLPEDIHDVTKRSAAALAGQGLMGVAKDNYGREGATQSFVIGFAVVELDIETGQVDIKEYVAATDCGTVIHPRSLAAQMYGGAIQGFGMARSQRWVFDPVWGVPFAHRFYTARPPGMLDVPLEMGWAAANIPDPSSPVGAKGIGEPPLGAGAAAIVSAISDALGGKCLCRTPLTADVILAELEGRDQPYSKLDTHV